MLSDRQDNGRVGDWHKHEDKRVGCYTGNSFWWIMTTLQNMFFLFFRLRLYDSFPLLWGSLTSKIKNEVNDSSIIRCLHVTESILMISDVIIYSRNQARNWLPYVALATLDWRI